MNRSYELLPDSVEEMATEIVDAAFQVHRELGAGLLESVYGACLAQELTLRKISFRTEVELPILYKGVPLDVGFRLDFIVDETIVLELKAVEKMIPLYEAQLLAYLKLANKRLGFLLNFNTPLMKDGIKRILR